MWTLRQTLSVVQVGLRSVDIYGSSYLTSAGRLRSLMVNLSTFTNRPHFQDRGARVFMDLGQIVQLNFSICTTIQYLHVLGFISREQKRFYTHSAKKRKKRFYTQLKYSPPNAWISMTTYSTSSWLYLALFFLEIILYN